MKRVKPNVVVSKCLGFAACRYNGECLNDKVVDRLKKYVNYTSVCPEMEIGLGVPRDPIRIITEGGRLYLFQPSTDKDVTEKMTKFASNFLSSLNDIDGFILKFKSPSCGLAGVKVYPREAKSGSISRTAGFFGAEVLKRFALLPIEDEGRLKNFTIREHFLTQLFAFAKFRAIKEDPKMKKLVELHSQNKLMLMAYSQKEMRALGKIVANHEKLSIDKVMNLYQTHFYSAFAKPPKYTSSINVLEHAFGYFSKNLNKDEKAYFKKMLKDYRDKKIPLSVPVSIIKSYVARFGEKYLKIQTFFDPYPEDLIEVTDSGKGRDIE